MDISRLRQRQQRINNLDHAATIVQREVSARLLERLDYMLIQPQNIFELTLHSDLTMPELSTRFPEAKLTTANLLQTIDPSTQQLLLPVAKASQDLVIANLVLHWCVNPLALLQELTRILNPRGVLLLTTFGPDTLQECRQAFAAIDNYPHVHDFQDMHELGDTMQSMGFIDPVVDMHYLRVKYPEVLALFQDLRKTGVNNIHIDRRQSLLGKKQWQQMLAAYASQNTEGIFATYELIFGLAWGVRQSSQSEEFNIPLDQIRKSRS